jgi:chemotaxis signal transduction protein
VASPPKSYLTFRVARQHLAMEASSVRGILPSSELMPLPGVRKGLLGLTALRGQTVAVLDLRGKLGLPGASPGPRPQIVIFGVTLGEHQQLAGFMADRLGDVVTYRHRDLQNGILKGQGRPRRLIDIGEIVSENDVAGLWSFSP